MIKTAKAQGQKIDVLWSHGDDEGIGGAQALTEAGLQPGKDVIVVSVDGLKITFEEMVAGRYNATIENPNNYGPKCVELVKTIAAGKSNTIPKEHLAEFHTLYRCDGRKGFADSASSRGLVAYRILRRP